MIEAHVHKERELAERLAATVSETVRLTGISRTTLYRLASAGKVRMIKIGRTTLVDMSSIRHVLATQDTARIRMAA